MAITNQQLTEQLALDLGVQFINRRPYAKEVFKIYDIELLPNSAVDTLLGEIFEWEKRNWRSKNDNVVGYVAEGTKIQELKEQLKSMHKINALVPDFEFSKEEIINAELKLPFLFDLSFTGNVKNANALSVKINNVQRVRLSNIDETGIEIATLLSQYAQNKSKSYRKNIKNDYIAETLFYAESVEIEMKKDAGVDIGIEFDINSVNVELSVDTNTEKKYKIQYKNNLQAPFGAVFTKGKDLF